MREKTGTGAAPHFPLGEGPSEPGLKGEEEEAARQTVERVMPGGGLGTKYKRIVLRD